MELQRYSHGVYRLRDDLPYAIAVRDFIVGRRYANLPQAKPIANTNRRYRLRAFDCAPAGKRLMLKTAAIDPGYPLLWKIGLFATDLVNDYAKTAFNGALALEQAGIATIRPVAYWTYRSSIFDRESHFLYEVVKAVGTVGQYQRSLGSVPEPAQQRRFSQLVERMAHITRRMHDAGVRHGDIHGGNFLMNPGGGETGVKDIQLYLIDTDRVSRPWIRQPAIKRILDLRCLRRLGFDEPGRRYFLRCYLGEDDYETSGVACWRVLEFWRLRRFVPRKLLKRWRRRHRLDIPLAQPRPYD